MTFAFRLLLLRSNRNIFKVKFLLFPLIISKNSFWSQEGQDKFTFWLREIKAKVQLNGATWKILSPSYGSDWLLYMGVSTQLPRWNFPGYFCRCFQLSLYVIILVLAYLSLQLHIIIFIYVLIITRILAIFTCLCNRFFLTE